MSKNYDEILTKALNLAKQTHPEASVQHQSAFANSVAYLCTGWSGGFGGPSIREHVACRHRQGEDMSFEQAVEACSEDVFGPLTENHKIAWEQEYCFDDDPKDLVELDV
jgi:hypothetical protein